MTTPDIVEFLGKLIACWAVGFTGGYLLTMFKNAVSQAV